MDTECEHGTRNGNRCEDCEALALLHAEIDRLRAAIIARAPQLLTDAPCVLCGYNGPGYYQPETHSCMAEYHAAQRAALKEGQ